MASLAMSPTALQKLASGCSGSTASIARFNRSLPSSLALAHVVSWVLRCQFHAQTSLPVSYTHLTLPTICSV
eukprot:12852195-Alexandrium_andersonii.AAC.1